MGLSLLLGTAWHNLYAADLAVVIDDVGYNQSRGLRAVRLPASITIAILPFAPHSQQLASETKRLGKDLIIHQPMEAIPATHVRHEADTLTSTMSAHQFDAAVERAIEAIPHTLGFSNHTGSLLTSQREPMRRFMRHLRSRGLIFLDSRTTPATVAAQVADELGVTALRRDVFLDHERSTQAIEAAFAKAARIARRRGYAVLVGHPYPVTLRFLEEVLPALPRDLKIVGLQELAVKHQARLALEPRPTNPHISLGQ